MTGSSVPSSCWGRGSSRRVGSSRTRNSILSSTRGRISGGHCRHGMPIPASGNSKTRPTGTCSRWGRSLGLPTLLGCRVGWRSGSGGPSWSAVPSPACSRCCGGFGGALRPLGAMAGRGQPLPRPRHTPSRPGCSPSSRRSLLRFGRPRSRRGSLSPCCRWSRQEQRVRRDVRPPCAAGSLPPHWAASTRPPPSSRSSRRSCFCSAPQPGAAVAGRCAGGSRGSAWALRGGSPRSGSLGATPTRSLTTSRRPR